MTLAKASRKTLLRPRDGTNARPNKGWLLAQQNLALMYLEGRGGLARDTAAAVRWLMPAAEQGLAAAQYNLGVAYETGDGVMEDDAEAVRWYQKAADAGHARAPYALGLKYASGDGVGRDSAEAIRWYRLAAARGNAEAQNDLAVMYDAGGVWPRTMRRPCGCIGRRPQPATRVPSTTSA